MKFLRYSNFFLLPFNKIKKVVRDGLGIKYILITNEARYEFLLKKPWPDMIKEIKESKKSFFEFKGMVKNFSAEVMN